MRSSNNSTQRLFKNNSKVRSLTQQFSLNKSINLKDEEQLENYRNELKNKYFSKLNQIEQEQNQVYEQFLAKQQFKKQQQLLQQKQQQSLMNNINNKSFLKKGNNSIRLMGSLRNKSQNNNSNSDIYNPYLQQSIIENQNSKQLLNNMSDNLKMKTDASYDFDKTVKVYTRDNTNQKLYTEGIDYEKYEYLKNQTIQELFNKTTSFSDKNRNYQAKIFEKKWVQGKEDERGIINYIDRISTKFQKDQEKIDKIKNQVKNDYQYILKKRNSKYDPKQDTNYWDSFSSLKQKMEQSKIKIDNEGERQIQRIYSRMKNKWEKQHENLPNVMKQQSRYRSLSNNRRVEQSKYQSFYKVKQDNIGNQQQVQINQSNSNNQSGNTVSTNNIQSKQSTLQINNNDQSRNNKINIQNDYNQNEQQIKQKQSKIIQSWKQIQPESTSSKNDNSISFQSQYDNQNNNTQKIRSYTQQNYKNVNKYRQQYNQYSEQQDKYDQIFSKYNNNIDNKNQIDNNNINIINIDFNKSYMEKQQLIDDKLFNNSYSNILFNMTKSRMRPKQSNLDLSPEEIKDKLININPSQEKMQNVNQSQQLTQNSQKSSDRQLMNETYGKQIISADITIGFMKKLPQLQEEIKQYKEMEKKKNKKYKTTIWKNSLIRDIHNQNQQNQQQEKFPDQDFNNIKIPQQYIDNILQRDNSVKSFQFQVKNQEENLDNSQKLKIKQNLHISQQKMQKLRNFRSSSTKK